METNSINENKLRKKLKLKNECTSLQKLNMNIMYGRENLNSEQHIIHTHTSSDNSDENAVAKLYILTKFEKTKYYHQPATH